MSWYLNRSCIHAGYILQTDLSLEKGKRVTTSFLIIFVMTCKWPMRNIIIFIELHSLKLSKTHVWTVIVHHFITMHRGIHTHNPIVLSASDSLDVIPLAHLWHRSFFLLLQYVVKATLLIFHFSYGLKVFASDLS